MSTNSLLFGSEIRSPWRLDPGRTFFATSIEISLSLVSQHTAGHTSIGPNVVLYVHMYLCDGLREVGFGLRFVGDGYYSIYFTFYTVL
jgi:hypothetical protein